MSGLLELLTSYNRCQSGILQDESVAVFIVFTECTSLWPPEFSSKSPSNLPQQFPPIVEDVCSGSDVYAHYVSMLKNNTKLSFSPHANLSCLLLIDS